jgi:hypothetical protein
MSFLPHCHLCLIDDQLLHSTLDAGDPASAMVARFQGQMRPEAIAALRRNIQVTQNHC